MLIHDVAALCGVTPQTIREWVKRRGFPAPTNERWKLGRRGRPTQQYDAGAVARWLEANGAHERAREVKEKS